MKRYKYIGIWHTRLIKSLILQLLLTFSAWGIEVEQVKIGVLAKRGAVKTLERWSETAKYLSNSIPEHEFTIIPLDFNEIDDAVIAGDVDFILVNSGIYVQLERKYNVSRIATLKNRVGSEALSIFGGVIFTRSDRNDINTIEDIKGKRLSAVDETSLGGFQMAWREMNSYGLNPYKDVAALKFTGTHDKVVYDVLEGNTDIGTVRTDTLERMSEEGRVEITEIKVLNRNGEKQDFNYLHSTQLYPEWPFARLMGTPDNISESVAIALMNMPADSPAAESSQTMGWTIPLNYQPVHQLFIELGLPPYERKPVSWKKFITENLLAVALILGGLFITTLYAFVLVRINRRLNYATTGLKAARDELEVRVKRRTLELEEKEQELETLFENIPSMVFVKDAEELRYVRLNKAGELLLGKSRKEMLGRVDNDLFPENQADSFTANDRKVLQSQDAHDYDQEPIDTPEGVRYLHTRKVCIRDTAGNPKYLLGISNDITEKKEALEKLDHLASHDPLTGLYNRRILEERLIDEMNRVRRYHDSLAIFMLDIDHFKVVNDKYGHQAGDEVLRHLSATIRKAIRKTDYAARYGGEEFTIVLPLTSIDEAEDLAERLRIRVAESPINIGEQQPLHITISIGVASASDDVSSWESLMEGADKALYQAKQGGRNQIKLATN